MSNSDTKSRNTAQATSGSKLSAGQDANLASARNQILDAAERLYADYGLGAVSLRQISAAAGARNTNAVQYHFKSAEGLIRAILERRASDLEMQKAQLLAEYGAKGPLACEQLLAVFYLPILTAENGKVTDFARFFLVLMAAPGGWKPIIDVFLDLPVTQKVLEMMTEANHPVPIPITRQRVLYSGVAMFTYIVNATQINSSSDFYAAVLEDALRMGSAALTAPVGEEGSTLAESFEQYFIEQGVMASVPQARSGN